MDGAAKSAVCLPAIGACAMLMLWAGGCGRPGEEGAAAPSMLQADSGVADLPLASFQVDLLDLACETATLIPVRPHLKDRSRAQEAVVLAYLELDQPRRALACLERIDDWRRGVCYAELAFYCARRGATEEALHHLASARKIAETAEDWRQDRVRVKVARTYVLLGWMQEAVEFEAGVEDSEAGKGLEIRAMCGDDASFDARMRELEELVASGKFDILRNALGSSVELFSRFYHDTGRRALVEDKIKTSWDSMPAFIRIDLLTQLAEAALDHDDRAKALDLVDEARLLAGESEWRLEHELPMTARLARLRHLAGDTAAARADADAALARYREQGETIVNIWRAGALRPLAEAYQTMGDTEAARTVYRLALEAGVENPNSRPRAEDLSATCLSMALSGFEPDEALRARLLEIRQGLGAPW